MKKCVFAGTFDPVTVGHEEIIGKASGLFDEVIVAVCVNVNKKTMFPLKKRMKFLDAVAARFPNVRVVSHDGLLVDLLKKEGAIYNVRGLRNGKDFDYESDMNFINTDLMPELVTVYLPCGDRNIRVSSTAVRELLSFGKDVSAYLPSCVKTLLEDD